MKCGRAPRGLEAIAGHYFQRVLSERRTVGREQDVAVALRQMEGINKQFLKIIFNLKGLAFG